MSLLINKILEFCLKVVGLWPYSKNYIGQYILFSTLVTTLPFQCWNALKLTDNPVVLMDSLSDIFAELLIIFKVFMMWMNKCIITDLLKEIMDDWNRKVLPPQWPILALYCKLFCSIDIAVYASASALYYPEVISNYISKPQTKRVMLLKSQYPFNNQKTPIYEILNLFHVSQSIVLMIIDSLSKCLLVAYVLHVSARIQLLEGHVQKFSKSCIGRNNKNYNHNCQFLKILIREHLKIMALVHKINSSYSYISLLQIVFSAVLICVTGFVIIIAMESADVMLLIKFVLYIIAMLSQCFTFCFVGQYLKNKGELIVHMVYNSFWYYIKPNEIKTIMFVLKNAQQPLTLNGGKLFQLSINTFIQILKTSFSYLSVLRAMYT